MQLFYNPDINLDTKTFAFDREESKHIIKVLRKKGGDKLYVTNGLGDLFITEIAVGSESKCIVNIVEIEHKDRPAPELHLAVAPTKMNDRYEWFLEKSTEIGIAQITPIICERSERRNLKVERFEKILQSAMKQSHHYFLPKLNEAVTFKEFVEKQTEGAKFIAHCEPTDKKSLKELLVKNENATLLIGPEGDFTEKEIKIALENNYVAVSLGNTRLRTETAAIVACHSFAFVNE